VAGIAQARGAVRFRREPRPQRDEDGGDHRSDNDATAAKLDANGHDE